MNKQDEIQFPIQFGGEKMIGFIISLIGIGIFFYGTNKYLDWRIKGE